MIVLGHVNADFNATLDTSLGIGQKQVLLGDAHAAFLTRTAACSDMYDATSTPLQHSSSGAAVRARQEIKHLAVALGGKGGIQVGRSSPVRRHRTRRHAGAELWLRKCGHACRPSRLHGSECAL